MVKKAMYLCITCHPDIVIIIGVVTVVAPDLWDPGDIQTKEDRPKHNECIKRQERNTLMHVLNPESGRGTGGHSLSGGGAILVFLCKNFHYYFILILLNNPKKTQGSEEFYFGFS